MPLCSKWSGGCGALRCLRDEMSTLVTLLD